MCAGGTLVGGNDTFDLGVLIDTTTGFLRTDLAAPGKVLSGAYCSGRSTITVAATAMAAQNFTAAPPAGFSRTVDYTATAAGWTTTPASFATAAASNPCRDPDPRHRLHRRHRSRDQRLCNRRRQHAAAGGGYQLSRSRHGNARGGELSHAAAPSLAGPGGNCPGAERRACAGAVGHGGADDAGHRQRPAGLRDAARRGAAGRAGQHQRD